MTSCTGGHRIDHRPRHTHLFLAFVLCKLGTVVTISQVDLLSLTPLFIAGSGRPQLRVAYSAIYASVALLQVVDN